MRIFYISPSSMPSKAANLVHVLNQVEGFSQNGYQIELFFRRNILFDKDLIKKTTKKYGINSKGIKYSSIFSPFNLGISLIITLRSFPILFFKRKNLIISRNLYAAYFWGVLFNKRIIYETHTVEKGLRGIIQLKVIKHKKIKTLVITKALKLLLIKKFNLFVDNIFIIPDAAKSGLEIIKKDKKNQLLKILNLKEKFNYELVCGYFGHLYKGRGIELILEISKNLPNTLFLIYGGNQNEIDYFRNLNKNKNVIFKGYCSHMEVNKNSRLVDILLMPYQEKVSLGLEGTDTSRWMSPMKMFEYMSTGVPIISSDIPVLREVLKDSFNCLFSIPNDPISWVENILKIRDNKELAKTISRNAFNEYKNKYTWKIRAKKIIEIHESPFEI